MSTDGSSDEFVYSLKEGFPSDEALVSTATIIKTATQHLLQEPSVVNTSSLFQYGPLPGDLAYRQEVAKLLNSQAAPRQMECTPENLLLTCGATHGLHLVYSLLLDKGDTIFIEDPTFFTSMQILRVDFRMNLIPVPTDDHGMDVDALEDQIKKHLKSQKSKSPFSGVVYLIPTFNNPKGFCYSPERCVRIVELARRHNLLVICDDVYSMLNYHEHVRPPRNLIDYDLPSDPDYTGGNLLSVGSFSKILGPGMRIGFIRSSPKIVKLFENSWVVYGGGGTNHYSSMVVARALQLGLCQQHLTQLRKTYSHNIKKVFSILRSCLPPSVKFTEPQGGYFIWITLPERASAEELFKLALHKYHVTFHPGNRCSAVGNFSNCLRLCFVHYEEVDLIKAVHRFCEAVNDYLQG